MVVSVIALAVIGQQLLTSDGLEAEPGASGGAPITEVPPDRIESTLPKDLASTETASTTQPIPATTEVAPAETRPPPPPTDPTTTLPETTVTATVVTSTTTPLDPEFVAFEQLQTLIAQDASTVETMAESWVPQLSAKRLGLEWEGVLYDHREILRDHTERRDQFGAVLVDGGTYNFRLGGEPMVGWFMTLVPESYSSAEGALSWCTAQRIDADSCFAKLLTNRQDAGTTIQLNP